MFWKSSFLENLWTVTSVRLFLVVYVAYKTEVYEKVCNKYDYIFSKRRNFFFQFFYGQSFRKFIVLGAFLIKVSGYSSTLFNKHSHSNARWNRHFRKRKLVMPVIFCFLTIIIKIADPVILKLFLSTLFH